MYFGTLAVGLGCFPLDNGPYHPLSHCQVCSHEIRSLIIFSTPSWGHHIFSALPSCHFTLTLALKQFRGEPAISEFVWNFTSSHNSSANVSTGVGSVLHQVLPQLQPDHG